ncbi:F-box protein SKIP19-like [Coffea arabica]|uniref:F-box protein SKIP19-like n=1 Tax=Coffea arabica TaxID=13443 RepID=A0A6P6UBH1_COFAR|nr:putative F-box/LRR-repeat protein 23 [Coffea arabica]
MGSIPRASTPPPPWVELPPEITTIILQKLGTIEILTTVQLVCKTWRDLCVHPAMWRIIDLRNDMRNDGSLLDSAYDLEKICRHAVDRSQGQLIDINIEFFGTDDLLYYISQRSGQLRRLRLVFCYHLSGEALSKAVKKMPYLEELQLYYTRITKEAIEAVGHSCPHLKCFRLNNQGFRRPQIECDEEALAVAENMPSLCHLQLFGNKMTNEGLKAILDGCHHLESLDLRHCFNLCLEGSLERRCSQQIKELKRPHDSTEDYEFECHIEDFESSDEDYSFRFSDIDHMSLDDDYYEFSDLDDEYFDYADLVID